MIIGITGSSSVLGTNLLKKLKDNKIILFKGRLENKNLIDNWIKKNNFDCIIHLAAIVPVNIVNNNKKKAYIVNFIATKNLVNSIIKHAKKKIWFFYSSSSHVYSTGNVKKIEIEITKPTTYYGKLKVLSERYILKNKKNLLTCIGRIFSFTSKKQKTCFVIPNLIKKFKSKKKELIFHDLNHFRDFLILDDISLAIKLLMIKKKTGIFNICSGKKVSLINLAKVLNKNFKKKIKFTFDQKKTIMFGDNGKLLDIGWKPKTSNYLKYINNYYSK